MNWRIPSVAVIGVVATIATFAGPVSAQSEGKVQHGTAGANYDPELSPLGPLASRVELLGESKYASTFAGVQLTHRESVLNIYVVSRHDRAFLHAVAAADNRGLPYVLHYVTRSYATLAIASKWIASNLKELRGEGIAPQWWGPNPPENSMQVALGFPTSRRLADLRVAVTRVRRGYLAKRPLSLAAGTPVTASTYRRVARAVLSAEAPPRANITIFPVFLKSGQATGYGADFKPFDGADKIWYKLTNDNYCTGNFSVHDAVNTTQDYMITAAHCSGQTTGHNFYTCYTKDSLGNCNYNVGTVKRVYYSADDFELMPTLDEGYVWNDSNNSKWSVNGYVDLVGGDYATTDGATDGANFDIYVLRGGGADCETYGGHEVCNAILMSSHSTICPGGDSGGPMLVRESDGYHIHAGGIIQGRKSDGLGDYYCIGQEFSHIRSEANVRLIWGN